MPAPEGSAEAAPEPDLPEAEFDARIAEAGLQLADAERENVLIIARHLRRSVGLIRAYNSARKTSGS